MEAAKKAAELVPPLRFDDDTPAAASAGASGAASVSAGATVAADAVVARAPTTATAAGAAAGATAVGAADAGATAGGPLSSSTPASSERKHFSSPSVIVGFTYDDHVQLDKLFTDFCVRLHVSDRVEQKDLLARLGKLLVLDNEQLADEAEEDAAPPAGRLSSDLIESTVPDVIAGRPAREQHNHALITSRDGGVPLPFGDWVLLISPLKSAEYPLARKEASLRGFTKKPSHVHPKPTQRGDGLYELAVSTTGIGGFHSCFYIGETGDLYRRLLYGYAADGDHLRTFIEEALRVELFVFARWVLCDDIEGKPNLKKQRVAIQDQIIQRYNYARNVLKSLNRRRPVYVPDYDKPLVLVI
jgi:hypothetical protein